jgi:hypothetical protein
MNITRIYKNINKEKSLTNKERLLVNSLTKAYDPWIFQLSPKEIHAIRKYTKNSLKENKKYSFFRRLNKMLESETPETARGYKKLNYYSNIISAALKKSSMPQNITCYRGVDNNPAVGIDIGEHFKYKSFISTSLFRKHAFKCKYLMIIHIPKGIHAAYIDNISRYKGQYEVLIDKDYSYRLLSKQGNTYEMEVCNHD